MPIPSTATKPASTLAPLWSPRSVALIGASDEPASVGSALFNNLFSEDFKGVIYPVNPKRTTLKGVKCYASVTDIDEPVDLAVIVTPGKVVLPVLRECGEKGVPAAVVITAGFGETGQEGKKKQQELACIARDHGIALVGPNCLGIINGDEEVRLNATFGRSMPRSGNISFLSQSGAVGVHALEYAASRHIGFSKFVSMGNKAIIDENDLLKSLKEDPHTDVIMAYIEHFSHPREFIRIAREVTTGEHPKPILLLKAGRSESGKRATSSHTGALAEDESVFDSLFEQCGIIRAEGLEDLFDNARLLARQPIPKGNRLGIITNAGGPAIIASDTAERSGLQLPEPSSLTQEKLMKELPSVCSPHNPIDLVGDAGPQRFDHVLKIMIETGEVDALLVMGTPQMMTDLPAIAEKVVAHSEAGRARGIPLITCFADEQNGKELARILGDVSIPNYDFAENAVRALGRSYRYGQWSHAPVEEPLLFKRNHQRTDQVIEEACREGRPFLTEPESYNILRDYGFHVAPFTMVTGKEELEKKTGELSFPLVAKVVSREIIHKVDVGGVVLGVKNPQQLKEAWDKIHSEVPKNAPEASVDGILFQEMVQEGVELIIGANHHEHFGSMLMFGLGGSFVEIFRDVAFRIAPITPGDAKQMVQQVRSHTILEGYRGKPPRDIPAIEEGLQRLSQLITEHPAITEIDLNPVFAQEKGMTVADARILLHSEDPS